MEGHQWTLYEEVLHIPLVIRMPEAGSGREVKELVELLDVAPTLLELAKLSPLEASRGRSLVGLMEDGAARVGDESALEDWEAGQDGKERQWVFGEVDRFNSKRSLRGERYKLVETRGKKVNAFGVPLQLGFELYDLTTDPGETRNLAGEMPELEAQLRRILEAHFAPSPATSGASAEPSAPFDDDQRRQLKALGYGE